MMKICTKCKEEKNVEEFGEHQNCKDGYRNICKTCNKRNITKEQRKIQTLKYKLNKLQNIKYIDITEKECSVCKIIKDINNFYKNKLSIDKHLCICKECKNNYDLNRNECKREYINISEKECIKCNIIKNIDCFIPRKDSKDGYTNTCSECKKNIDAERTKNRVYIKIKSKSCVVCKIHKKSELFPNDKTCIDGHRNVCKKCTSIKKYEYHKKRLSNDNVYKLRFRISDLIRHSLNDNGYTKNSRTFEILGCTFDKFLEYLNNNNYGFKFGDIDLDLDHIIPVSSGETEEDIIKLNHYTNFQLLPSDYNRNIKRDKEWNELDFKNWQEKR